MAETRERILDAAASIMRNQGLARATTKEIARAAGLSEPALYRHFRDKEELFHYVLKERLPGFIAAMKNLPMRVGRGDVARTLEAIARAALVFYAEVVPMAGSVFSEKTLLARHQRAMREDKAGPQVALTLLAGYLRAEQGIGRIPKSLDTEAATALLLGACFQRAFILRFVGVAAAGRDDRRFARRVVSTLLRQSPTR